MEAAAPVVLVVDDEPLVRRAVQRALQGAGYAVHIATSGTEALQALQAGLHADLIVSDVMMDDMVGPEFVAEARTLCPSARVLFMSGETPENLPEVGLDKTRSAFLEKPFGREDFLAQVQALLNATV